MRLLRLFFVVLLALIAGALWMSCSSIPPNVSLCATGEVFVQGQGCVCKPDHVPDEDGKGCHRPDPPPTTTTTTSSTTTTTTTSTTTTSTTLAPGPTQCAPLAECAAGQSSTGVYGCCRTVEHHPDFAGESLFASRVEQVLEAWEKQHGTNVVFRPDDPADVRGAAENAFVKDIAERLRAMGLCATTKRESPRGGASDEVGVKTSPGRSEQFDVVLSGGKIRHGGYVAVCKPARF